MSQEQQVSIVIPTYNREAVLPRAIRSALRQTWQNFELIIVDDGSADRTEQAVSAFRDDRIRYVRLEKNGGVSHARNVGIAMAESEYIALLDSDDEWLPDKLERQMRVMLQASGRVGMVYCRMERKDWEDETGVWPRRDQDSAKLQGDMLLSLLQMNVIGAPTMLIRRSCLTQVGAFDEGLRCLEDWELVLRIAEQYEIGFVEDILVEVHYSPGSVSTQYQGYVETRCYMIAKYWKVMADHGILKDVMGNLLLTARQIGQYDEARRLLEAAFGL